MMTMIGLAIFDRPDGVCETGWMSDGYDTLARFTSLAALDANTIWFSNIKWDNDAYATIRRSAPWIREDGFFGFSLSSLITELCGSRNRQQVIVALPSVHVILSQMVERLGLDLRSSRPLVCLIDRIDLPVFDDPVEADIEKDFFVPPWVGLPPQEKKAGGNAQFEFRLFHLPRLNYYLSMLRTTLPTGSWARGASGTAGQIVAIDPPPAFEMGHIPAPFEGGRDRQRKIFGWPEVAALPDVAIAESMVWGGDLQRAPMPLGSICVFSMADALALEVCFRARSKLRWIRGWQNMTERIYMHAKVQEVQAALGDVIESSAIRISGYGKGKISMMCRPSDVVVIDKVMMECGFEPPATYGNEMLVAQLSPLSILKAIGLPLLVSVEELQKDGMEVSRESIFRRAEQTQARYEKLNESVEVEA